MCGIAGIWSKKGSQIDEHELRLMAQSLQHRGPDAEGLWLNGNIGFAHRRLKVVDLSDDANQPFTDGADVLVFNGEVFNFRELRKELEPDFRFVTKSDTEVLFRALQKWGRAALDRLDGQFAFAFFRGRDRSILLARDHVGICPLYVWNTDSELIFASEIKAILSIRKSGLDKGGVLDYFGYRYNIQNGRTLFAGIERFAPATSWSVDTRAGSTERASYWRLRFAAKTGRSAAGIQDELNRLLDCEIAKQTVADVPVGIYLSGGIDSRALLYGFSRTMPSIEAVTMRFSEQDTDYGRVTELQRRVAFNRHTIDFGLNTLDDIEEVVRLLEDPFGDLIICANYALARRASESVKVVLSGEGGDESFLGYDHQRGFLRMAGLPGFIRRLATHVPAGLMGIASGYPGKFGAQEKRRISGVLSRLPDAEVAYLRLVTLYGEDEIRRLFCNSFLSDAPASYDTGTVRGALSVDKELWQSVMRVEIEQLTLIVNLLKQDRFSMRFSMEGRVPFVSRSVLEFAASLPRDALLGRVNKSLLLAYSGSEPFPKAAFSVLNNPAYVQLLSELLDRYADRASVEEAGVLSVDAVGDVRRRAMGGGVLDVKRAMAVVVFMVWWRVFRSVLR